jgi:hypothetical protein
MPMMMSVTAKHPVRSGKVRRFREKYRRKIEFRPYSFASKQTGGDAFTGIQTDPGLTFEDVVPTTKSNPTFSAVDLDGCIDRIGRA